MASKNIRILTLALVFSVFLNIALLASFAQFASYELPETALRVERTHGGESTNSALFEQMSKLSFRELVSYLTNREPVEEGFTKRDLALSTLVALHHFNLEKAIASTPSQIRTVSFSDGKSIDLFPALDEEQFGALIRYAYQEKWPLTPKGLFSRLQQNGSKRDESLEQAFFVTPQFHAVHTLFQKTAAPQDSATLLQLVLEGSWGLLENFASQQAQRLDFSIEKRREFLLQLFSMRSATAGKLLLHTDFSFVLKRFEDRGILDLLSMIQEPTEEELSFCVQLSGSPRSDAVRAKANELLLGRLDAKPAPQELVSTEPVSLFHTVLDGETLWKISRHYKVKVEEIVKLNDLEKETVFPGMTLKIPQKAPAR